LWLLVVVVVEKALVEVEQGDSEQELLLPLLQALLIP
jgi:hypothetical protein